MTRASNPAARMWHRICRPI